VKSCCASTKPDDSTSSTHSSVQEYYGKLLQKSDDLQTNACTSCSKPPQNILEIISSLHEEVTSKYYGCGLVIPQQVQGMKILDLGNIFFFLTCYHKQYLQKK
jgi:arsenite methyltransferase